MVLPCISVGLCSPRFSRHAVARQQAGWDGESWAWHSALDHQIFNQLRYLLISTHVLPCFAQM